MQRRWYCGGWNNVAVYAAVSAVLISSSAGQGHRLHHAAWWIGLAAGLLVGAAIAGMMRWPRGGC